MKILLISPLPPPKGGIATWTESYLQSDIVKRAVVYLVNTAQIGKRLKEPSKYFIIDEIKRFLSINSVIKKYLKSKDIQIIHINSSCSPKGLIKDYFSVRGVSNKINLVIQFHCDIDYMIKNSISRMFFKKLCFKANHILVLNEASKKYVEDVCGRKSIIVPNFIKDVYSKELLKNKIIREKIEIICFVGHITKEKGCDLILRLAKKRKDIIFFLVGKIYDQDLVKDKLENVIFTGEVDENQVKSVLLGADLFIFPSHTEGFPVAVLEAMAMGLPILASPVGAVPDMIEGGGGILVDWKKEKGYLDAIQTLDDVNIRKKMHYWNQSKVHDKYTDLVVMEDIINIYKDN